MTTWTTPTTLINGNQRAVVDALIAWRNRAPDEFPADIELGVPPIPGMLGSAVMPFERLRDLAHKHPELGLPVFNDLDAYRSWLEPGKARTARRDHAVMGNELDIFRERAIAKANPPAPGRRTDLEPPTSDVGGLSQREAKDIRAAHAAPADGEQDEDEHREMVIDNLTHGRATGGAEWEAQYQKNREASAAAIGLSVDHLDRATEPRGNYPVGSQSVLVPCPETDQANDPAPPDDSLAEWIDQCITSDWSTPAPERKFLVKGWLPENRLAMLAGRAGDGKSKLTVQLCHSVASTGLLDRRWFEGGPEIDGGEGVAVLATWEDDADEIKRRLFDNYHDVPGNASEALDGALGDRFHVADLLDHGPIWQEDSKTGKGELTETGVRLRAFSESVGAKFLAIDSLATANDADEIARRSVRAFTTSWDAWSRKAGCTTLLVAHPSKGSGDDARYSGSTQWRAGVRSFLWLEADPEKPGHSTLYADKINYGPKPDPIGLHNWTWWKAHKWTAADEAAAKSTAEGKRETAILKLLGSHVALTNTDLKEKVKGRADFLDATFARLVKEGNSRW